MIKRLALRGVLVVALVVPVVETIGLGAGTTAAHATGGCTTWTGGTYLGSWQGSVLGSAVSGGFEADDLTFSGSSVTTTVSASFGGTVVLSDDSVSGSVGCTSFSITASGSYDSISVTVTVTGGSLGAGAYGGTWTAATRYGSFGGTWAAEPVSGCITPMAGTYIGAWQNSSGTESGGLEATVVLNADGVTFTGSIEMWLGESVYLSGSISGSVMCYQVVGRTPGGSFVGSELPNGTFSGYWNGGTWTAGLVTDSADNGGSTSSDSTSNPSDPIQATVAEDLGENYDLSINEAATDGGSVPGYDLLGTDVQVVSAAPTSTSNPLTITLTVDDSVLAAAGITSDLSNVTLLRNGVAVASCTATSPSINPNPCISQAVWTGTAGASPAQFTVLTSQASVWTFGSACRLSVATSSLPDATIKDPYQTKLTGCGGDRPYQFSESGTLPTGLMLASNGDISGTPKKVGTYRFYVIVKDHEGGTARKSLKITVG